MHYDTRVWREERRKCVTSAGASKREMRKEGNRCGA